MTEDATGIMGAVMLQRRWLARARAQMRPFAPEPCGASDAYAEWAIRFIRETRRARVRPAGRQTEIPDLSYAEERRATLAERLARSRAAREVAHATP